ncbi:hypothetical protein NIES4071_28150 [Calothrix sp. NIES-4071]|nr:hypothetical protein NIES4071_28150 [Calothrix sp. NIES-4071]BAZ57137.1 hypothetical protein NIES4105_28090 [Calothrix sp. NIES-4105]
MSNEIILLDSGPLGAITNLNSKKPNIIKCQAWFYSMLEHYIVLIPVINDYEVRRELIHQKLDISLNRLNNLPNLDNVGYLPITTKIMLKAAQLWGWARSTGQSTAQSAALDGDVILAATAIIAAQELETRVIIATTNVKDLQRYHTDTYHWDDLSWFT